MMRYTIFNGDNIVNIITADETFVKSYCEEHGYTYSKIENRATISAPTETEQIRADIDYIAAMTGVEL